MEEILREPQRRRHNSERNMTSHQNDQEQNQPHSLNRRKQNRSGIHQPKKSECNADATKAILNTPYDNPPLDKGLGEETQHAL